jgi:hypothetical protein
MEKFATPQTVIRGAPGRHGAPVENSLAKVLTVLKLMVLLSEDQKQSSGSCLTCAGFLLGLLLYTEDGSDKFLRNDD